MTTLKAMFLGSTSMVMGAASSSVEDLTERLGFGFVSFVTLILFMRELFRKVLIPWTTSSITTQKSIQQSQAAITRHQEQLGRTLDKVVGTLDKVVAALDRHQMIVEEHMKADVEADKRLSDLLTRLDDRVTNLGCRRPA